MNQGRQTKAAALAEKLHSELLAKRLPAGSPAMSARELAQRFSISTVTANRILDRLVEEDVLYRVPQSGTFVKYDPPVIPVIAYAGPLPDSTNDDPIQRDIALQLMEHFVTLNIEPKLFSYHIFRHQELAKKELKNTNGLLLHSSFIDEVTLKAIWDYPGQIAVFGNAYIIDDFPCSQVIPDFTEPMLKFNRDRRFEDYDKILLLKAAHRNSEACAENCLRIFHRFEVTDKVEIISLSACGNFNAYHKAFRYFSQCGRLPKKTLIVSPSRFFVYGIRDVFSSDPAAMPDILSLDHKLGQIACEALDLLLGQLKQTDRKQKIIRISAEPLCGTDCFSENLQEDSNGVKGQVQVIKMKKYSIKKQKENGKRNL